MATPPLFLPLRSNFGMFPNNFPISALPMMPTHVIDACGCWRRLTEAKFGQPRPNLAHLANFRHISPVISLLPSTVREICETAATHRPRKLSSPNAALISAIYVKFRHVLLIISSAHLPTSPRTCWVSAEADGSLRKLNSPKPALISAIWRKFRPHRPNNSRLSITQPPSTHALGVCGS